MNETIRIAVGFSHEYEQAYAHPCQEGETEGTSHEFEVRVPAGLWHDVEDAETALSEALDRLYEAAGFDDEGGRLFEPCGAWSGSVYEGVEWWTVVLSESGDPDTWPIRDVPLTHFPGRQEAEQWIEALPDLTYFTPGVGGVVEVERDRLRVEHKQMSGHDSDCHSCGWSREEHDDG